MKTVFEAHSRFFLSTTAVFIASSWLYAQAAPDCKRVLLSQGLVGIPYKPKPLPPEHIFREMFSSLILTSTPDESRDLDPHRPVLEGRTMVLFEVNRDGTISNPRVKAASYSLARDFWTLYAVASCPPIIPPPELSAPVSCVMDNIPPCGIGTESSQKDRAWLRAAIPKKKNSKFIYFALIPASFREAFPAMFTRDEICARSNLVGIPIAKLVPPSQPARALRTNLLPSGNQWLSQFLSEWSLFFKKHSKPSKQEIIRFADSLKTKYKEIFVLGVPEAPDV